MGFIMDGLGAEAYDREYSDRQLLKRIIGYFRPHFAVMILVGVLIFLNSVMDAAFPFLIARGLDQLQAASGQAGSIWGRSTNEPLLCGRSFRWSCNHTFQTALFREI